MEINKLYKIAEKNQINIHSFHLPATGCVALKSDRGLFVGIDPKIFSGGPREKVCLAHELGHLQTDSLYNSNFPVSVRLEKEKKADLWAIKLLIPLPALKKAIKNGYTDVFELSEYFGVTEKFMAKAIEYYNNK